MRKVSQLALCLVLSPLLAAQQTVPSPQVVFASLPKGTQVNLVLLQAVSSLIARKRQTVRMAVAEDLTTSGYVLIPAGTPVVGIVWRQRTPIPGKRNGYVWVKPSSLTLPDGSRLKLLETPPGWNKCGGMGTWCLGYIAMAPYTIVGLASLLFGSHYHPSQPGKDLAAKACLPLPGYIAKDRRFRVPTLNALGNPLSIASARAQVAACNPEFPPVPYNFGKVAPPTVSLE